ncbi:ribosome biogenesis factor YjgA [Desulfovibrio aminophilus]|uniref:ribosome biogenesis factor YjgA n=1 Tax=Desulfovibrio aminophilus TaxID=81425 RepID=UPI0033953200
MSTDDRPKSRSQKKREMTALQDTGARLVELSPEALARVEMPETLRRAVLEARKMKGHEARRRQLQYIGALMRDADPEPIHRALEIKDQDRLADSRAFQRLERWRDGLVEALPGVAEEILAAYPTADVERLTRMAAEARREREKNAQPKAFRALFRTLRDLDSGA